VASPVRGWGDECPDNTVGVQHANGAGEQVERDNYRMVEMTQENRNPFASPSGCRLIYLDDYTMLLRVGLSESV
jgi:hypothetical protein